MNRPRRAARRSAHSRRAVISLGFFDIEFESRNRDTGATTKFDDDVVPLDFGAEELGQFVGTPWFAAVTFTGWTDMAGGDLDRRNAQQPAGGRVTRDDVEFEYERWLVTVRGGWVFRTGWPWLRSVALAGGVAWDRTKATTSGVVEAAFDSGVVTENRFRNDFEREGVMGLINLDAHIAGPLFGRVQVLFDDHDVSVVAKATWRFGL